MAKVLVVDDDRIIQKLISTFLKREGIESVTTSSAVEGMRILESGGFDVVTCDLNMPEVNGYELLKRIQDNPKTGSIPVVIISASGKFDDYEKVLEAGAAGVITKPFSQVELVDLIRRLI